MSYVISGTTVSSVDYEDVPFGGQAGNGSALSSADTWISYTMDRPNVRTAMDGKDYFIVKNVSFRVCSAPLDDGASGVAYKMYGRVSYADGSSYVNSYQPPNSVSWQKSPTVTYTFQGTWFHVAEGVDGTTIRVWLVSGGPFLFQRNPSGTGHIVGAAGQTFAGSPAGYITIAQVASPPQNFTAVRSAANPQQITMTWSPPEHMGGTASGYHVQVAEDADFTVGVREYYPAIKSGGALTYSSTGYSPKKAYWFRIAARNEVSEYFKLKGGTWSTVQTVPAAPASSGSLPADTGVEGGTSGGGTAGSGQPVGTSPGGATGSGGSTAGTIVTGTAGGTGGGAGSSGGTGGTVGGTPNDPGDSSSDTPTTGSSGSTGGSSGSTSGSATSDLQKVLVRITEVLTDLDALDSDYAAALAQPSATTFKTARADANALNNDAAYIVARSANTTWLAAWSAITPLYTAAYAALSKVASSLSADDTAAATDAVNALIAGTNDAIDVTPDSVPDPGGGTGGGGTPGGGSPDAGGTIVYTPIPDTSANRSSKFGRLISRQPRSTETRVFLYDRGGRRRLGQLHGFTQVSWGRIRDDISNASVFLTPEMALRNKAVIDRLGVARSEVVIYRGDQRVWEGPVTYAAFKRSGVEIQAQDWLWYANKTPMRAGYTNAYPNVGYVVDRIAGILSAEMVRLETPVYRPDGSIAVPPINVMPYLHTYVEEDDARTSAQTDPYSGMVWAHLDDLAQKSGIDYTVVGRALHIWDTSRAAMGRTRTVTEHDFIGDPYIAQYGSEVATVYTVTDGQGDFASFFNAVELNSPYYGQLELLATAYGSQSTTTTTDPTTGATTTTTTANTVSVDDMGDQATRGAAGRDPVPWALHIPDNSSVDVSRSGLGIDVLIPGVYVPVMATFSGRSFSQIQKIKSVQVSVTASKAGQQESVQVTMEPASDDDMTGAEEDE